MAGNENTERIKGRGWGGGGGEMTQGWNILWSEACVTASHLWIMSAEKAQL